MENGAFKIAHLKVWIIVQEMESIMVVEVLPQDWTPDLIYCMQ